MTRTPKPFSPFVYFSPGWRSAVVAYFFLYQLFLPAVAALGSPDAQALLVPRVFIHLVYLFLLCWPLIFYRSEYGVLHPLLLPTIFITLKTIAKFPVALFTPFSVPLFTFDVSSTSNAVSLANLSSTSLAWTRFEYEGVQSLALVCYYAGYFALRRARASDIRFFHPRSVGPICCTATIACVAVAVAFISVYGGGLGNLLVAMRGGRHELFRGQGQFLQIARFAAVPGLVWFAYARRPLLKPAWLATLIAGCLAAILATGSRSAVVNTLVVLTFLWWRKAGRPLLLPTIAVGIVATLVVGTFGAIRQDYGSSTLDTSVLSFNALGSNVAHARAEFAARTDEEADLAAFSGAHNGLLMGRSYLGAAVFLLPRALWPAKPVDGGVYNQAVNFSGRSISQATAGSVYGIPMSAASEAYWNFSLAGVVVVMFLLGMLSRWLATLVWRNPESPAALIVAVWVALTFNGTSYAFVNTARDLIMLALLYYALGIWRPHFAARRSSGRLPQVVNPRATLAEGGEL